MSGTRHRLVLSLVPIHPEEEPLPHPLSILRCPSLWGQETTQTEISDIELRQVLLPFICIILHLLRYCYLCFLSRECRERRDCFSSQREVQSIMAGEWRQQELGQLLASKESTHGSAQLAFSIYEIQDPC